MQVYRYLTGKDDVQFCARVTAALNEGYRLHGSPTMTFNGTDVIVGQAIIKDVKDETEMPQGLQDALNAQKKAKG
jgi:hypothetical protein